MGTAQFVLSHGGFVGHLESRPKRNFDEMNDQNGIGVPGVRAVPCLLIGANVATESIVNRDANLAW
jgi:hypothetical protein